MTIKHRKILVTGGAGFLGSHIADRLIQQEANVVVVDNLSSGKKEHINPKARFYKADIGGRAIAGIFAKEKPEIVFHFAAHIEARVSVRDPLGDAKTNILGSINVLEQCRAHKVKRVLFASSGGEVYGAATKIPTSEEYAPRPISPYGVAKFAVEKYLDSYFQLFALPYAALRYGNVYGPRQNPRGEAGVVAIFTDNMLRGKTVFIHGNGKQTKDYIFVEDAVEASVLALQKDFQGSINIGTGKETSVLEIFRAIQKLTGYSRQAKHVPSPAGSFPKGCLSIAKAKKELVWQPKISAHKGFEQTVQWFQSIYES